MEEGRWLRHAASDAVVVFIHGILSQPETAWRHSNGTYWPELLMQSAIEPGVGIYVYHYRTGIFSGSYSLSDVVDELKERFRLDGVLQCKRIVMVAHSMGGIVARQYLVTRCDDLRDHRIGLFLVASPSIGAEYANWITGLANILRIKNAQAAALRFSQDNAWLNDLDKHFRNLKERGVLTLTGKELIEDTFYVLKGFWRQQVVPPHSGARYFGESLKVAGSTHSSIATPEGDTAIQHRLLCEFVSAACKRSDSTLEHTVDMRQEEASANATKTPVAEKPRRPEAASRHPTATSHQSGEASGMHSDFFISYTQANADWAEWIAWQLEAAGYRTTFQPWDFRPGGNFVQDIQRATAESERTILVLSAEYLVSSFTQAEWQAAYARDPTGEKRLVLPVRVGACEPKGLLAQIQRIDLIDLDEASARDALLKGVALGRAKPAEASRYPGEKKPFPSEKQKTRNDHLADLRTRLAKIMQPCPAAMEALTAQFDKIYIPTDSRLRAERLAELLTLCSLERFVQVINRAHHELLGQSDPASLDQVRLSEGVLVKVVNSVAPRLVEHTPVNQAREHFLAGTLGILALPTSSHTMAEIVMAAADNNETDYEQPLTELDEPRGKRSLQFPPEAGAIPLADVWLDGMRTLLKCRFVHAGKLATVGDDMDAVDKEINKELDYRLTRQKIPERYYVVCAQPTTTDDPAEWGRVMQKVNERYRSLVFIALGADDSDPAEGAVTRALRDFFWRIGQSRMGK